MYPYDYTKDDNGLSLALLAPLFVAVFSAKHLPLGLRHFLWKNYWWLCTLVFIWIGSNYTENFMLLLIFAAVGAFGGLIGANGFDPGDFKEDPEQINSPRKSTNEATKSSLSQTNANATASSHQTIPDNPNQTSDIASAKLSEPKVSDSAQAIIDSQRKIYDQGLWLNKAPATNSQTFKKEIPTEIGSTGWKYDKVNGVLWNTVTKETLLVTSGLGYSLTEDHFILYNKVEPRKILRSEVIEDEFNLNGNK